jgi:hypothetical protein
VTVDSAVPQGARLVVRLVTGDDDVAGDGRTEVGYERLFEGVG